MPLALQQMLPRERDLIMHLLLLVMSGTSEQAVPRFVQAGSDLSAALRCRDCEARAPLIHASMLGHTRIVQALITAGLSVVPSTFERHAPMRISSGAGHLEVVKYLMAASAAVR